MPSLKNFKTKFSSKSKKSKTAEQPKKMPPAPGLSQTPPTRKRMMKTAPEKLDVRTSAPAAMEPIHIPEDSIEGVTGVSTSLRSLRSSRSPSSSRLQIDEHKQLKEVDRPEEPQNSSDPDTSLLEYDDDRELTINLRRTMSFPEGNATDQDEDSWPPTIPVSESPIIPHEPVTLASMASPGNSLRNSLNTSIKSRTEHDSSLRRSIEEAEAQLHVNVGVLAQLTSTEKSKAVSEKDQLDYYKKLESSAEQTLGSQEELINRLRAQIEHLEGTVAELQKYKECTEQEIGAVSGALEAENKNLKNLVYKVKQEMSHCQAHHQFVKDPNGNKVEGLPADAPTPAWMIDFKYLSPLIKSLEDQVAMKTQELASLKRKFAKYEADIRSLTAENDNLRGAMKAGGADPEAIGKKAWDQLQKQALLVVEENEVLLKELDMQEEKMSQIHEQHYFEMSQLEDKMKQVEAERQVVSERLADSKCQLEMSKSKCEQLTASMALRVDREEYNRAIMEYKAKLENAKDDLDRNKESFLLKLSEVKFEQEQSEQEKDLLNDELKEAKHESRRLEKCIGALEEDCAALTREVKKGKDIVAKLLLVTDEAVHEKQSLKHFLQTEKKDKKKSVGAIVESELLKEKLVNSFKRYKIKAEKEIDKLVGKLEKQGEEFDVERREYERQIKHLRLMVHEKDVQTHAAVKDKQDVEECLELVWKATQSDNHDINNSLRKSMRDSRERHLENFWMNDSKTDVLRQSAE